MKRKTRVLRWLGLALRWTAIAASWLVSLGLGVASTLYDGPHSNLVQRDLQLVFYTTTWAFGLALFVPRARPWVLAALALAIASLNEALQLWHPHALEVLRADPLGRLLVGSGFAWSDFLDYLLGSATAALWLALLPFRTPTAASRTWQTPPLARVWHDCDTSLPNGIHRQATGSAEHPHHGH